MERREKAMWINVWVYGGHRYTYIVCRYMCVWERELMYEFMGDIDIHSMSVYVCMRERINVRVEGRHRYT